MNESDFEEYVIHYNNSKEIIKDFTLEQLIKHIDELQLIIAEANARRNAAVDLINEKRKNK